MTKQILFNDFKKKYKLHEKEIGAVFKRVLKSGWYILGKEVENFEKSFARFLQTKYAVGVNSATDALSLSLQALGVKSGDEVITVANTATPTITAIRMAGGVPVFVDIDPDTYNINPDLIVQVITKKTKAIVPVHLFGYPAEMAKIMSIARKHKLKVVEDVAQGHGAKFKGRYAGTFGDMGCFSFYPTKNLGAFGDGGAVVTNNKKLAEAVRQMRNYGEQSKFYNVREGVNSRLDELQAAILAWGLKKLPKWNNQRRLLAQEYYKELKNLPIKLPPKSDKNRVGVYHLFVTQMDNRNKLQNYLAQQGIQTAVHYPRPVYEQPAYKRLKRSRLKETEKAMSRILSLPIYPEMTLAEVRLICKKIKEFYGR